MVTVSSLDPLILERSVLKHPFYQKWSRGELTKADLQIYAKEYFHLVTRVPTILEAVKSRALERGESVSAIEHNLEEEKEHVDLWVRFAKALGVSEQELREHPACATVREAVASLEQTVATGSYEDCVALMYALECDLPAVAQSKKDGLEKFYGMTNEDAHAYFDAHLLEEAHLRVWRDVPLQEASALKVAETVCAAQNKVLDGVCEAGHIMC